MENETICYEQPLHEHIRTCLRLEHLFKQVLHTMHGKTIWDTRSTITGMLDILHILDRTDLKGKLAKEMSRFLTTLSRYEQVESINQQKLSDVLVELENLTDILNSGSEKLAQELRENEFLNTIRLHMSNPAGACDFESPAYNLWLQRSPTQRSADLAYWLSIFEHVHATINILLRIIRESGKPQQKVAQSGFFQTTLDPQVPSQLIRVKVTKNYEAYPEISVGRHGVCVRFFELFVMGQRPTQTEKDIPFTLSVCVF